MEFGLGHLADRTKITKPGSSMGTPAYLSPEQVRGERVEHQSDIWPQGVALYEMVTGRGVPIRLDQLVERALAKTRTNDTPTSRTCWSIRAR